MYCTALEGNAARQAGWTREGRNGERRTPKPPAIRRQRQHAIERVGTCKMAATKSLKEQVSCSSASSN
jgi:hypothetical protein